VRYLYQSGYYSYLIKVGLGLGEDANGSFALFNLSSRLPKLMRNSLTKQRYNVRITVSCSQEENQKPQTRVGVGMIS